MRAELFPIIDCPIGKLAIMPRPRGGDWLEDEVHSWRKQGMDTIVSLLEDDEISELGLSDEPTACSRAGLQFLRFPIQDRGVPSSGVELSELVSVLTSQMQGGRGIGIHCRIGVGRSACLAVCVLTALGMSLAAAWAAVQRARGLSVPDTEPQRDWVAGWFGGFSITSERGQA